MKMEEILNQKASKELEKLLKSIAEEHKRELLEGKRFELKTHDIKMEEVFGTMKMGQVSLHMEVKLLEIEILIISSINIFFKINKILKTESRVIGNCLKTLEGHISHVSSVDFDGKGLLASGSWDKTIRLWEVSTGNCLKTLEGHTCTVMSVNFDGKGLLASGSDDKLIRLWE